MESLHRSVGRPHDPHHPRYPPTTNAYSLSSEDSDGEELSHNELVHGEHINQYERIGDRNSGSTSSMSGHPKSTHYAESAIYRRSRGYPSPIENESSTLPIHVPPPPQFLLNREGWSSGQTCTTLEHIKNKNNIIPATGHQIHLQNNLDQDFEPSCLLRTQSGSLFIPTDGHKGLGNPLQANEFTSSTMPLKSDSKNKGDRSHLPSGVPVLPVRSNFGRPISSHFGSTGFHLRKTISSHCSWKCTAITFMLLSLALFIALTCFMG